MKLSTEAVSPTEETMEESKNPEECLVFDYYKLFSTKSEQATLAAKYRGGNFGYGHAKQEVFEKINALLEEPRDNYHNWQQRPDDVIDILDMGAKKARAVARDTISRVRNQCGL